MSNGVTPKKFRKSEAGASGHGEEGRDYDAETQKPLEEINKCQNEIDSEGSLAMIQRFIKSRKAYFDYRNEIMTKLPNFWLKVFVNHPQISAILDGDEKDCLQYMKKLEVENYHLNFGYKINFHFKENPYFENEIITKQFYLGSSGDPASQSTTIHWKSGKDLTKRMKEKNSSGKGRKRVLEHKTLFGWLTDHSDPSADDIADVIKDDIWLNPQKYYRVPDTEVENGVKGKDASDDEEDGEDKQPVEVEEEEH